MILGGSGCFKGRSTRLEGGSKRFWREEVVRRGFRVVLGFLG